MSRVKISAAFECYSVFQSRQQTAVHLVASRQTGTATSILRALLTAAGKDIRLRPDGVSFGLHIRAQLTYAHTLLQQKLCKEPNFVSFPVNQNSLFYMLTQQVF